MKVEYKIIFIMHNLISEIIFYTTQHFNSKEIGLEFIFFLIGKYYHV